MNLNTRQLGDGPALIILHGLFGSLDNWQTLARDFAQHHTVILVDQRNHGRSPHHDTWDYESMAQDLHKLMDQLGITQASILGHSMGGKVALQFAQDYPERLQKLIVVDMGIKTYEPHHENILKALNAVDLREDTSRKAVDQTLEAYIPDPKTRLFLMKGLARQTGKRFAWRFNLPVITAKYEGILQGIEIDPPYLGKALLLYGGESSYILEEDKSDIQAALPNATFFKVPNAGHWVHADAPQTLKDEVINFLLS